MTISVHEPIREGRTCAWPIGDPSKKDFRFCGAKRDAGQSYCEEHVALAYQKGGKRSKTLGHSQTVAARPTARRR
jgi:hypothetical protein